MIISNVRITAKTSDWLMYRNEKGEKIMCDQKTDMTVIHAGDMVKHIPSGEKWIVAGINHESGKLIPMGYPFPRVAEISDCELVERDLVMVTEYIKESLRKHGCGSFVEG